VRTVRDALFDDDIPISDCAQRPLAQRDKIVVAEKAIISTLGDVDLQPGIHNR
jgi:hypothetical protein